ncbi:hypothetical protein [Bradyrhizobium sp. WD16]|uniref:hypothetical protein n=1 Tax=Bradyrhizobium sp. WD16 TaxID=1521768 RepID=UPI0020A60334|nr:hypothetical protein [Bradyrhizobium sp. WD16]UTD26408.1 hypothetical protein DB459_05210 [Bradyrhizobium sp. WD16]
MLKSVFATALVVAVFAGAAQAQVPQRSGTPEEQKACSKDVSRYCRTVMNESDLVILSCLQQNRPKISQSCDKVLASHGQ